MGSKLIYEVTDYKILEQFYLYKGDIRYNVLRDAIHGTNLKVSTDDMLKLLNQISTNENDTKFLSTFQKTVAKSAELAFQNSTDLSLRTGDLILPDSFFTKPENFTSRSVQFWIYNVTSDTLQGPIYHRDNLAAALGFKDAKRMSKLADKRCLIPDTDNAICKSMPFTETEKGNLIQTYQNPEPKRPSRRGEPVYVYDKLGKTLLYEAKSIKRFCDSVVDISGSNTDPFFSGQKLYRDTFRLSRTRLETETHVNSFEEINHFTMVDAPVPKNSVPVFVYDLQHNLIGKHNSIQKAVDAFQYDRDSLRRIIKKNGVIKDVYVSHAHPYPSGESSSKDADFINTKLESFDFESESDSDSYSDSDSEGSEYD